MLPIGDDAGRRRRPAYVTWTMVAVATVVYAYQIRLPPPAGEALVATFGLVPARLLTEPNATLPTLLTHVFLHGSILHLAGNMLFLVVFGRRVESMLGSPGFLGLFLIGGMLAGLASVAVRWGSTTPGIGASGAISTVLGAYLVLFPAADIRILVLHPLTLLWIIVDQSLLTFSVPALLVIGVWFGLQVLEGLAALASPDGVDYAAHVGGFAVGFGAVQILRRVIGLWPDEEAAEEAIADLPPALTCLGYARPLAAGHLLTRDDLQAQPRRAGGIDADAIPVDKLEAVLGRRLLDAHYRYEPVRWSDLEAMT